MRRRNTQAAWNFRGNPVEPNRCPGRNINMGHCENPTGKCVGRRRSNLATECIGITECSNLTNGLLRDCFVTTHPRASLCSSQRRSALIKFLPQKLSIILHKTHYHKTFFCPFSCTVVTWIEVKKMGQQTTYYTFILLLTLRRGEKFLRSFGKQVGSKCAVLRIGEKHNYPQTSW